LAAPAAAGLASWLLVAQPGAAIKEVETPDGRRVQAWEFDVPLRVVALRGSVPAQVQTPPPPPIMFCWPQRVTEMQPPDKSQQAAVPCEKADKQAVGGRRPRV
jgi:hypothetical protein